MLQPRLIPCLLLHHGALVKTIRFADPTYVGDPLNAVRIFNEKAADELMLLDISATSEGAEPNYNLIAHVAAECRMPLCYGGGIHTLHQALTIVGLGVEKIALSTSAIANPSIISAIAARVGTQSVAVVLDVRAGDTDSGYVVYSDRGQHSTGACPLDLAATCEAAGAGEIVLNSIDNDGTGNGYCIDLAASMRTKVRTPLTIMGGAASLADVRAVHLRAGPIGCAAGTMFVFRGRRRAVLITYPSAEDRRAAGIL